MNINGRNLPPDVTHQLLNDAGNGTYTSAEYSVGDYRNLTLSAFSLAELTANVVLSFYNPFYPSGNEWYEVFMFDVLDPANTFSALEFDNAVALFGVQGYRVIPAGVTKVRVFTQVLGGTIDVWLSLRA